MKRYTKLTALALLALMTMAFALSTGGVNAQTATLTVNSGATSTTWFITGEPSLVMNGFDLDRFPSLRRPIVIESVSISVVRPVPGQPVDVVIYGDKTGGSPVDATLLRRQTVPDIGVAGLVTITLDAPLEFDGRFLWVGFYLPVGFEFLADRAGTSTLTYWAWTPDSTFDLGNLASAQVFGPANGSAPVNLNMNGAARITVGLTGSGGATLFPQTTATPVAIRQVVGDPGTDLSPMVAYSNCSNVFYDSADINITYRGSVSFHCRIVDRILRPPQDPPGYDRRGVLFDVYVFGVPSGTESLPFPVTHCIRAPEQFRETAILGVAHGAPREWIVLPSVRFGDLVCAELKFTGFLSILTPR